MKKLQKKVECIEDKVLATVPERDNGEKLVPIKDFIPKIIFTHPVYIKKQGKKAIEQARMARIGVAKRLVVAQSLLPKGYRLVIRSCYRCLATQKKAYDKTYARVKKNHPDWSEERVKKETSRFVAPLYITPPHSTGGAVDLSIIGPAGKKLDMGTKMGVDYGFKKILTDSIFISMAAKKNRLILISAMTTAGFVNYPTEWWHWSYGDQYWAALLKKPHAIYTGI
jgi:D-alanyl-D-alanine dipeptidase